MPLKNRTAVITGATGGLGPTAARLFAEKGARLALVGSSAEKLDALGRGTKPARRALAFNSGCPDPA